MLDFEMKISNELDQCQREGMQALRRFKEMLRTDRVEHQA
jgi:predicted HicB family RNase H-like nuclease